MPYPKEHDKEGASVRIGDGDREERIVEQAEIRLDGGEGEPLRLVGYAAVFNELSQPFMGIREIIRPGTFSKSIKKTDVALLYGHNSETIMARTSTGNLKLREDEKGLRFEATLDRDDQDVQRILPKIKRGDLSQMSFGFRTVKDKWTSEGKETLRELQEVDLFDVSVVTFPAYPKTTVAVRDRVHAIAEEPRLQGEREAALVGVRQKRLTLEEKLV